MKNDLIFVTKIDAGIALIIYINETAIQHKNKQKTHRKSNTLVLNKKRATHRRCPHNMSTFCSMITINNHRHFFNSQDTYSLTLALLTIFIILQILETAHIFCLQKIIIHCTRRQHRISKSCKEMKTF